MAGRGYGSATSAAARAPRVCRGGTGKPGEHGTPSLTGAFVGSPGVLLTPKAGWEVFCLLLCSCKILI